MSDGDKFAAMLGFARRAGKAVYGYDNIRTHKRIKLLAVSDSASDNLLDGMKRLSERKNIELIRAVGLEAIAGGNCKALGITDENMAREMYRYASSGAGGYSIV